MGKKLKGIIMFFIMSVMLSASMLTVLADAGGNAGGEDGESATSIFEEYGWRMAHSGWLIYIIDESGTVCSDVAVWYSSDKKPPEEYANYCYTRFGNIRVEIRNASIVKDNAPFGAPFGSSQEARGPEIKTYMLSETTLPDGTLDVQIVNIVYEAFGAVVAQEFVLREDLYLILEPIAWFGYIEGSAGTYAFVTWVAGTAPGIAQFEKNYGNPVYGNISFKTYTNSVFPKCCMLEYSMLGITAPGATNRYVTNNEIINNGYGVLMFWKNITPPVDPGAGGGGGAGGGVGGSIANLFRIKNYARGFDISVAIPSAENIINEMEAKAFHTTGHVTTGTYNKLLTTTYTYYYDHSWQEYEKIGEEQVLITPGYYCGTCGGTGTSTNCADCGSSSRTTDDVCSDCGSHVLSDTGGECSTCGGTGDSCAGCNGPTSNFSDQTCGDCLGVGEWEPLVCTRCGEEVIDEECRCVGPNTSSYWEDGPLVQCSVCRGTGENYACDRCGTTTIHDGCRGCGGTGHVYGCNMCGSTNVGTKIVCGSCGGTNFNGVCDDCGGDPYYEPVYETRDIYGWVTKYETRSTTRNVSINAHVNYEVLDAFALYSFDELKVMNKAFDTSLTYNASSLTVPQATASIVLYNNYGSGTYSSLIGESIGATEVRDYHYYIPELPSKSFTVSSLSDVDITHAAKVEDAKDYLRANSWSRNDSLTITCEAESWSLMEDTKVYGCIIDGIGVSAASSAHAYGGSGVTFDNIDAPTVWGRQTAYIPGNTNNGVYKTRLETSYKKEIGPSSVTDLYIQSGKWHYGDTADNIYDHVVEGLESAGGGLGTLHTSGSDYPSDRGDGYHIMVYTPVLSFIRILEDDLVEADTPSEQLIDVDAEADFYLRLDEHYYIEWNSEQWRSGLYDGSYVDEHGNIVAGDSGVILEGYESFNYDRFVENKYAKFPFDVYYNGTYYYTKADGYTEWILLEKPANYEQDWYAGAGANESNNHWQMTPFYIPTWAEESSGKVLVKVDAINKEGRYPESEINPGLDILDDLATQYTAQVSVKTQTYGWVYGFTVLGINDKETYVGYNEDAHIGDNEMSFVSRKLEKVAGSYNRAGKKVQRYLLDGTLHTGDIEIHNTLPFRRGSNPSSLYDYTTWQWYDHSGEWSVGTGVSFLLKTIGNMDATNDYIEIKPVYKYVYPDGTVLESDEIKIAFIDYDTKKYLLYSDADVGRLTDPSVGAYWYNSLAFSDEMFKDSFDTGWISYTTARYNRLHGLTALSEIGENFFYNVQSAYHTKITTPGIVRITDAFRLYSGEYEELTLNSFKYDSTIITYEDWNSDGAMDSGLLADYTEAFSNSMQTWYGAYYTPTTFNVYTNAVFDSIIKSGTHHDKDDKEYAFTNGKLVLGFEITVYQNGVPHLKYADMWKTEGYTEMTTFEYFDTEVDPKYNSDYIYMPKSGIVNNEKMIEYGDIAVINLRKNLSERYENGLWALD